MSRAALKLVDAEVPPAPVDITGLINADIKKRNWGAVHVAADRREPVLLSDRSRHVVLSPPSKGCALWRRDRG